VRQHRSGKWQARYLDIEGRAVARNWPTEDIAWAWLEWIEARRYRWTLDALQTVTGYETRKALARALGVHVRIVERAVERGLSDDQADRWACALGYHPASVWGQAWFDAALETFPADAAAAEAQGAVA
jgi:hypothetical protein